MYICAYICVSIPYIPAHMYIIYVDFMHIGIYNSLSFREGKGSFLKFLKETRQRNNLKLIKRYHTALGLWNLRFGSEASLAKTCISVSRTNGVH